MKNSLIAWAAALSLHLAVFVQWFCTHTSLFSDGGGCSRWTAAPITVVPNLSPVHSPIGDLGGLSFELRGPPSQSIFLFPQK